MAGTSKQASQLRRHSGTGRRRLALALALLATTPLAAKSLPAPNPADCEAGDFARVLQAAPAKSAIASESYWLDRAHIQWPGLQAGEARFSLQASATGQLVWKDDRLFGSDEKLELVVEKSGRSASLPGSFNFLAPGLRLRVADADLARLPQLLRGQVWLVASDARGHVLEATGVQNPGALDDWYSGAASANDLGVSVHKDGTGFALWAPTAQSVALCLQSRADAPVRVEAMQRDDATGIWRHRTGADLSGGYYRYLVDVVVPGVGLVRNRVTDPYSISLDADSQRSYIANLDAPALKPAGWDSTPSPHPGLAQTDMVIYELHVRDFSINDASVPEAMRGKYSAFGLDDSQGMRQLKALAAAGLTDLHLLPVFDLASVPERGCVTPKISLASPADEGPQAAVAASAARDCFNWGYDPLHYSAPEGSYSSDANDGAARIIEFRRMVQGLHRTGLRAGMDVVYNHTSASGQKATSVLDRIVPGYYQRLNAKGEVEHSTCCENTATEHPMMAKLMVDSVRLWATQYKIDSFRFDLMAHQPRSVMQALQADVDAATGRHVNLIGEGWNFGEIANGARFVQASQLSLNGSGIGTFSDRGRDAVRGGSAGDSGTNMISRQGWVNGLVYARNAAAPESPASELMRTADMLRVGLAGSIRDFHLQTFEGQDRALSEIPYGDQPAGYVREPAEVVNYVENHDNHTLFDINAYRLPRGTSSADRARVQLLAAAVPAFSQGVAYYHAGVDLLRSKSLDRNSFDSGDWFNRIDWSGQDNYFGTGLPPKQDNGRDWEVMRPLLADASIKPTPADIAFTRAGFLDLLRIRASSRLFRLPSAAEIRQRLSFPNSGPNQNPLVLVGHLDGKGLDGANFREVLYFLNASEQAQTLELTGERGKAWVLHPVHRDAKAADDRPRRQSSYDGASGRFVVPARTALVYVVN